MGACVGRSLDNLAEALVGRLDRARLVDALYVIRAPRTLEGIVPICREFRDWRGRYPELCELPSIKDYPERLATLDAIADLVLDDDRLMGRTIRRIHNPWTPLFGVTGDSVVGELCLTQAGPQQDAEDFQWSEAWLLWQTQRFNARFTSPGAYQLYLESEDERLAVRLPGRRLYDAYLGLRSLAGEMVSVPADAAGSKLAASLERPGQALPGEVTAARAFHGLAREMSEEAGERLATLYRELTSRDPIWSVVRELAGIDGDAQRPWFRYLELCLPSGIGRLLVTLWGHAKPRIAGSRQLRRVFNGRENAAPEIIHGRRLTEILRHVGVDERGGGTIIEFFQQRAKAPRGRSQRDSDDDEPPAAKGRDPTITLFLADQKDLLKGYYAALGQQNAIEYENALLPWSKWMLSRPALAAVRGIVDGSDSRDRVVYGAAPDVDGLKGNARGLDRLARFAIGLCLLTGRPLDEVAGCRFTETDPQVSKEAPVAVDVSNNTLWVRAGEPEVMGSGSARVAPKELSLCHMRTAGLVLPLPQSWRQVVQLLGGAVGRRPSDGAIASRARKILRQVGDADGDHPDLRLSERGVRFALVRELLDATRGDLGAIEAITRGGYADARNIIHYASYEADGLQAVWREAAQILVGPLPSLAVASPGYVGSQHPYDEAKLGAYFAQIRCRIQEARSQRDWFRLWNLATLYLSYWLELGLASRRTLTPVPAVIIRDRWAFVADKHREDGSTDRLVPLTGALQKQIDSYVALGSEMAIILPALDPITRTEQGMELRLHYLDRKRGVITYRPKFQEGDQQLTPLPANWGRKYARSSSARSVPGRFLDAELGHWVRGRHAWDNTSTFAADRFFKVWLGRQQAMERALGFVPAELAAVGKVRRRIAKLPAPRVPRSAAMPAERKPTRLSDHTIQSMLAEADPSILKQLLEAPQRVTGYMAMDLGRKLIELHQHEDVDRQRELAEAACAFIRKRADVPIFASRPRALFTNSLVLAGDGMQNLAWLDDAVLPAFLAELAHLPPRSPSVEVELGRLIMLAIWRLGLTRWPLIEAWLRCLSQYKPILAQGANRYQPLQVHAEHTRNAMHRTVYLDDFTCTYLVVEREHVCEVLLARLFARAPGVDARADKGDANAAGESSVRAGPIATIAGAPSEASDAAGAAAPVGMAGGKPLPRGAPATLVASRRRAFAERCVHAYLRSLAVDDPRATLTVLCGAAKQRLALLGTPLLAAYAGSTLETWDLDDRALRRLAGLRMVRASLRGADDALPATKFSPAAAEEGTPPPDLLQRIPVFRVLGRHRSPYRAEWRRLITAYAPTSAAEALLCQFALWLLRRDNQPKLSRHEKLYLAARIQVASFALLGQAERDADAVYLDGDQLAELQEASRDAFPERLQHGAWFQFHAFLSDEKADHAGYQLRSLGPPPERAVSARILTAGELETIWRRLGSVRSHIRRVTLRTSAQHQLDLMASFGMRRSESAYLRSGDYQGDVLRVQAYADHTLKTAWADRVVPTAFTSPRTRQWVKCAAAERHVQLIDAEPGKPTSPDNFFDRINRVIQTVSGDASMTSHHLRHTLVNRVLLTLLWQAAGLDALSHDLPWLKDLRLSRGQMYACLGREGDGGQGMRLLSLLVGHSHPTTTIRHYVHTLGVALHGLLEKVDTLDATRSFEQRLAGKSTVQRWVTQIRRGLDVALPAEIRRKRVNRMLRERIEARFGWRGIDRDETPSASLASGRRADPALDPGILTLDTLEQIDCLLRDRDAWVGNAAAEACRKGLAWLASLPTGKKGREATIQRHVLYEVRSGSWLPRRLEPGEGADAADALCAWLVWLRERRNEDYQWLLDKWAHASERERNRILLRDNAEVARAASIADDRWVALRLDYAIVPADRARMTTKEVPRLRIKCRAPDGDILTRDTITIRWVMSYAVAYEHARIVSRSVAQLPQ